MNLSFFHYRENETIADFKRKVFVDRLKAKGGTTIAVDVPSYEELVELADVKGNEWTVLNMGIAVCSEEDNYTKRIGRQASKGRMKPIDLKVQEVQTFTKGQYTNRSLLLTNGTIVVEFELADSIGKARLLRVVPVP